MKDLAQLTAAALNSPVPIEQCGVVLIAQERLRQLGQEGWTDEHDDKWHRAGDLAMAAACYERRTAPMDRANKELALRAHAAAVHAKAKTIAGDIVTGRKS